MQRALPAIGAALILAIASGPVHAELPCPPLPELNPSGLGPFDSRDPKYHDLMTLNVEVHHFNKHVEYLRYGQSSVWPAADIDYVLRMFPNHHRALASMLNLSTRVGETTNGATKPIRCYFEHAAQFAPDDPQVRLINGIYLLRKDMLDQAIGELKEADRLRPDDGNILYNLGLAYFDKQDFEKARMYAKRAETLGISLPGLKNKLVKAGQWNG